MFRKVTDHIYIREYMHYTDRPNIGLIVGSQRVLLFEAGNSQAHVELLKQELEDANLPMPDYVALSHWHWDHSFGAHAWNIPVIAGAGTAAQLRRMRSWTWDDKAMQDRVDRGEEIAFCTEMIKREFPDRSRIQIIAPDLVFEQSLTLDLGGVTCQLIHARGPHADDSVIAYIPEDRFLFLGDSNCKDLYGKPWHFDIEHEEDFVPVTMALPYDPELVDAYLRLLNTLDFTKCISGHSDWMTKEQLYHSFS